MRKLQDLTGMKFGHLTVISRADNLRFPYGGMVVQWNCLCDCGNHVVVRAAHLKNGHNKTCGRGCEYGNGEKLKRGMKKSEYLNMTRNTYTIEENIVYVKFKNSEKIMICDLEDWEKYKFYYWGLNGDGYAQSSLGKGKMYFYHRIVMNCPSGLVVDHINRNKLDNRKCNLRIVTKAENNRNVDFSKRKKRQKYQG